MVTPKPPSPTGARLQILSAAVLFSTGGAVVKATTISAWEVAGLRSAIAAVAIFILLREARRGWTHRTWLVGSAYAATMLCFVVANKLTTAANTIFLQGTAPLYVLMLSPWLLGERFRLRQLGFMAVIAAGMVLFFVGSQPVSATAVDPATGNMVAAAAGLFYGLLILGLRWLGHDSTKPGASISAVCCGNLLAATIATPLAFPYSTVSATDWAAVLFLGIFQISVAYVCLTRGIARVPALEASLILIAEPVLSPFWAWLVHGETPTIWALIGGVVILSVTTSMAFSGNRK